MSDKKTIKVELTFEEILFLDGKVKPETQEQVDFVKRIFALLKRNKELDEKDAAFVQAAVDKAVKNGELKLTNRNLSYCSLCKKSAKRPVYKRGPNKGKENYNKSPISFSGVDLSYGFLNIAGYANLGCCSACWERVKPILCKELEGIEAEISKRITGKDPEFKKFGLRKCTECGWEGHEGQLGELPALMSGRYKGKCPNCEAKNLPFGKTIIESLPGHIVLKISSK